MVPPENWQTGNKVAWRLGLGSKVSAVDTGEGDRSSRKDNAPWWDEIRGGKGKQSTY